MFTSFSRQMVVFLAQPNTCIWPASSALVVLLSYFTLSSQKEEMPDVFANKPNWHYFPSPPLEQSLLTLWKSWKCNDSSSVLITSTVAASHAVNAFSSKTAADSSSAAPSAKQGKGVKCPFTAFSINLFFSQGWELCWWRTPAKAFPLTPARVGSGLEQP